MDLEARLREGVPVTNVSRSLAYYSGLSTAAGLYGGDVAATARMLKHVAERMHYQIQVSFFKKSLVTAYWTSVNLYRL